MIKLANALLLLAIIATASALYLGRRPTDAAPEQALAASSRSELADEVIRLRREVAVMKVKIALLQNNRAYEMSPAPPARTPESETSDD